MEEEDDLPDVDVADLQDADLEDGPGDGEVTKLLLLTGMFKFAHLKTVLSSIFITSIIQTPSSDPVFL